MSRVIESDRIDGGGFHLGRDASAETVGTQVALAVYRTIMRN